MQKKKKELYSNIKDRTKKDFLFKQAEHNNKCEV